MNTKILYGSDREKELLGEIVPKIVEHHNIFLKDRVTYFWADLGTSIYDVHFEFRTEQCSNQTTDVYLTVNQDTLMSRYTLCCVDYSNIIGKDMVSELIEIINKYKNGEM